MSIVPTALLGDDVFRALWRTPKSVTAHTLFLFGCGAAAIAFGSLVAIALTRGDRSLSAEWPALDQRSAHLLRRAGTLLTTLTVTGYAGFAFLIARKGISPAALLSPTNDSGAPVRDSIGTIPGVTTMTQFGLAAVVISSVLLANEYSRSELAKLLTVIGLALPRTYIFSERLAIIELVVPVGVVLAARVAAQRGTGRRVAQFLPVVSLVALLVMFGAFEYFRSWNYYRDHTTMSYPQFVLSRFAGYYTTALNNGHLVLSHLQWPNRLPFDTLDGFWSAPGILSAHLYERLGGHVPPYRPIGDSLYFGVLEQFGNPEFNNQSGYVGPFVDYGTVGGILCCLAIGLVAGFLYSSFRQAKTFGLLFYPLFFLGLLEMPRYLYWPQGRATYAWIALLIVGVSLARSRAKVGGRP
ncbi:MAG: O-antigen polymerase [Mycobacterium sp.]